MDVNLIRASLGESNLCKTCLYNDIPLYKMLVDKCGGYVGNGG